MCWPSYCCWCAHYATEGVNPARFSAVGCRRYPDRFTAVGAAFTLRRGKCCPFFGRSCRRSAADCTHFGAAFYSTSRANAASFSAVRAGIMMSFYCCWRRLLNYGEGKCCRFSGRWCRRYAAHFTAVGAAFYTTPRVNAARFPAVGVGVTLHILLLLLPPLTLRRGRVLPVFHPFVIGGMVLVLLLLVQSFTQRRG